MSDLDRSSVFSSLLGDLGDLNANQQELPLDQIDVNPNQPRKYIDIESIAMLSTSIKQKGVLEPILVRPVGERYQVIAGERRTRAAKEAGLTSIPALIKDLTDSEALEIAIIENLQREDLNPVEETDGVITLLSNKLEKSSKEVIEIIRSLYDESRGRSGNTGISNIEKEQVEGLFLSLGRFSVASFYTNRLPLLSLPEDLLERVRQGVLNYTKAKLLNRLKETKIRRKFIKQTIENNLSREELERLVKAELYTTKGESQQKDSPLNTIKRHLTAKHLSQLPANKKKQVEKLLKELESLLT